MSDISFLSAFVRFYFVAESRDVAEMGAALRDAEALFADDPGYGAMHQLVMRRFVRFVKESVPALSPSKARFRALQLVTTIDCVGRAVAGLGLRKRVVSRWADDCAEVVANQAGFPQSAAAKAAA